MNWNSTHLKRNPVKLFQASIQSEVEPNSPELKLFTVGNDVSRASPIRIPICFGNSSLLLGYFNDNDDLVKRTTGIRFAPPPFNGNYVVEPEIINEEDIDPKTVLKINPITGEEMVYDSDSDDEIFDAQKIDGVPNDVKIDEPKVVKQVIRDRCILTEPDEVEKSTISPMLSKSGFISSSDIKKQVSKVENKSTSDFIKQKVNVAKTKDSQSPVSKTYVIY
ncbi:hypothetical protein L1987_48458 [Smallanthus sonchifolius]|uniref:Uncharacterized protein n=1 Tax=Smallanthus sonchifolius TaxID=185202 RepID=A0ACB9FRD7_9ASTR|nr:hypothetical protein L1987_48458 [Smallanthus sonchifolius]